MRRVYLLFLCFYLFNSDAFAETVFSRISAIDLPKRNSEPILLLIENEGRVLKVSPTLYEQLKPDLNRFKHLEFRFEVNADRWVQSLQVSESEPHDSFSVELSNEFQPTVFSTLNEATEVFKRLNPYYRNRSQCFNRAHIWSYEMNQKDQVKSMKVFLFFTRKYIREYNWSWWFHVSPFVYVSDAQGNPEERVMDYRFVKEPSLMRDWTDYFMRSKSFCPTVQRYSDYENHEEESYCYLIKAPMYYWQPSDLETLETEGQVKSNFVDWEVSAAYRQGF